MKKFVACLCVCALMGCSSKAPEKEVKVCKGNIGNFKVTNTYELDGDKVLKQTSENSLEAALSEDEVAAWTSQAETIALTYDVEGVTYSYNITEKGMSEKTEIDFTKADIDTLIDAGLLQGEKGKVAFVSFEITMESLEQGGFTCE